MARQLKVLHVVTTLTIGGAERQVEYLTRFSRHRAAVAALYAAGPVAEAIRDSGVPVHDLGDGTGRWGARWRLLRLIRAQAPDVVHVHLLSAQVFGIPAARLAGVPLVVSSEHSIMDGQVEGRPITPRLQRIYRTVERLATHTIAVSPTTARRLDRWGIPATRITVIDNGIDFEALRCRPGSSAARRAALGVPADTPLVGAVGRLAEAKRFDVLLDGLAPLLAAGRCRLAIAGAGPLREALLRQAARLGVAGRVHLVGVRDDVTEVLDALDVFVSTSRDETFGMAIVEAIGNGLPVVFASCPALDDLGVEGPRLLRLPDARGDSEREALRGAVARSWSTGRGAVPPELLARYAAPDRAAQTDRLYEELYEESDEELDQERYGDLDEGRRRRRFGAARAGR